MMITVFLLVVLIFTMAVAPLNIGLALPESNLSLGVINPIEDEIPIGNNSEQQKQLYHAFIDYIASKVGIGIISKLVITDNISAMTQLLKEQKIDLYAGSPFISAIVNNKSGSIPFMAIWLKEPQYYSLIVARKNSPVIYHIYDLAGGKTIGFTSSNSNTGYLLPKSFLIEKALKFSPPSSPADMVYLFTGSENNTLTRVLSGTMDAGALSSTFFNSLPNSTTSKLKIIGKTIAIPALFISHRSGISPQLIDNISAILRNMKLDQHTPEVLKSLNSSFVFDFNPSQLANNVTVMVKKAINGTESSYS
jgi:ABC-type phosphate/phosphonate transport system substrate-binding protein